MGPNVLVYINKRKHRTHITNIMGGQVVFNKAVGKRNFLLVVLDTALNF